MHTLRTLILAAAAVVSVSAQVTYNDTTGIFTCASADGQYCAGDSLTSNIIIYCSNYTGTAGNCNDNLARQNPVGVNYSPCYQGSSTGGDAACSKNCVVYQRDGSTFTLDPSLCTSSGSGNGTSSNTTTTTTAAAVPIGTGYTTLSTSTLANGDVTTIPYTTETGAVPYPTTGSMTIQNADTTVDVSSTGVTTATATPVKPTTAVVATAAAAHHTMAGALAAMGLAAAYLL